MTGPTEPAGGGERPALVDYSHVSPAPADCEECGHSADHDWLEGCTAELAPILAGGPPTGDRCGCVARADTL